MAREMYVTGSLGGTSVRAATNDAGCAHTLPRYLAFLLLFVLGVERLVDIMSATASSGSEHPG